MYTNMYTHVRAHTRTRTHAHIHTHTRTHAHIHTRTHAHLPIQGYHSVQSIVYYSTIPHVCHEVTVNTPTQHVNHMIHITP